jgi:hypothetical protein
MLLLRLFSKCPGHAQVHFITASCENMIDGRGLRSGDILTSAMGKTVEINNTDAEGRLTLADALWRAPCMRPRTVPATFQEAPLDRWGMLRRPGYSAMRLCAVVAGMWVWTLNSHEVLHDAAAPTGMCAFSSARGAPSGDQEVYKLTSYLHMLVLLCPLGCHQLHVQQIGEQQSPAPA